MCLRLNKTKTEQLKQRTGQTTVYKILERSGYNDCLYSPYEMLYKSDKTNWVSGYLCSNREGVELTRDELINFTVGRGFHVFDSREAAEKEANLHIRYYWDFVIVELTAYWKDFVAAGENELVFTRLFFSKEEYDRVKVL